LLNTQCNHATYRKSLQYACSGILGVLFLSSFLSFQIVNEDKITLTKNIIYYFDYVQVTDPD